MYHSLVMQSNILSIANQCIFSLFLQSFQFSKSRIHHLAFKKFIYAPWFSGTIPLKAISSSRVSVSAASDKSLSSAYLMWGSIRFGPSKFLKVANGPRGDGAGACEIGLGLFLSFPRPPPFRLEEENFIFSGSPQQEHPCSVTRSFS